MKKYIFFFVSISVVLLLSCSSDPNPVLNIEGGEVQGVQTKIEGVIVYKGIPFAAPPTGALRWREPQPVIPWEGVRIADKFGPAAIQNDQVPGSFYHKEFFAAGDPERSEDCLYLNIWTPAAGKPDKKLPVAMWIHGGGYAQGFGHEIEFDGEEWAKRGVILVTINYRLGIYGFLAHPFLSAESPHHVSGNYGIFDQFSAIRWIRKNISQFGGDPDNLTIFGQSAGAGSVQALVASPLTAGLIQKAIIQSGGGLRGLGLGSTLESAEESGQAFFDAAGLTTLEQMRAASIEDIRALQREAAAERRGVRTSPVVDGYLSTGTFSDITIAGKLPKIPYMIGYTANDMGNMGESIADFSLKLEELGRSGAYCYLFARPAPGDEAGAFHSSELWYIFGTLGRAWRPYIEGDYKLSAKMIDYWTNFAKKGNPNANNLPEWKPYTSRNSEFFTFNIDE
jgi:para-nitrobenzyl esterase